jgi:hypothetical protein
VKPVAEAAVELFKVVLPAAQRPEVERYCDHGMLRGSLLLGETEGATFSFICTDERDARCGFAFVTPEIEGADKQRVRSGRYPFTLAGVTCCTSLCRAVCVLSETCYPVIR